MKPVIISQNMSLAVGTSVYVAKMWTYRLTGTRETIEFPIHPPHVKHDISLAVHLGLSALCWIAMFGI